MAASKESSKVAIVTGGGSGIGKSAAERFSNREVRVIIVDRRGDLADDTARSIIGQGGEAVAVEADISQTEAHDRIVETAIQHYGRIDYAFNNAGILGSPAPIAEMAPEAFDEVVAINLRGVWLAVRRQVQEMLRLGVAGSIVNTSSFVSLCPSPGTSAYAASKAALNALVQAVALEVGETGIRINNVAPGVTDTPMLRAHGDDETLKPFADHSALKRLAQPRDIADCVLWLCSDEANFVTGQTISVDGGYGIAGMR